jgi:hypothetical protein
MSPVPKQKPGRSRQTYATPPAFIAAVKARLGIERFSHDFAADPSNRQAPTHFDEDTDAMTVPRWEDYTNQWLDRPCLCIGRPRYYEQDSAPHSTRRREGPVDGRASKDGRASSFDRSNETMQEMSDGMPEHSQILWATTSRVAFSVKTSDLVPGLRKGSRESETSETEGRPDRETESPCREVETRRKPEGSSGKTPAEHYHECSETNGADETTDSMDARRLGHLSTDVGEQVRVLRERRDYDARPLHSAGGPDMPWHAADEYGPSVQALQHQQGTTTAACVVQGQHAHCVDCRAVGVAQRGFGWLNPPFADICPWAKRCLETAAAGGQIAFLVPAAVGSNWFRDYCDPKTTGMTHVLFLNGRLAFMPDKPKWLYPKDCMLVLYGYGYQSYEVWNWRKQIIRVAA